MSTQRKRNRFRQPVARSGYKHKPKEDWGFTPRTAGREGGGSEM